MQENDFIEDIDNDIYTNEDLLLDLSYDTGRNLVINKFRNSVGIVYYKKAFFINKPDPRKHIDRSRKFFYDENDKLQRKNENVLFNDLLRSNIRSRRRALDSFFGYSLSNSWHYFITLTFDSRKVDRTKRSDIIYAWSLVRKKLQYYFPGIKIILISEEHHKDGALHFHGLLGNCNISKFLKPAINNKKYMSHYDFNLKQKIYDYDSNGNLIPNKYYGTLLKTEYGDQIYNLSSDIFSFGFSTVVELHKEELPGDNDKVINYLIKYMRKDYNSVGYNKKSYFRTYNLDFKDKIITKSTELTNGIVDDTYLFGEDYVIKDNDKYTTYSIPIDKYELLVSLLQSNNITNNSNYSITEELQPIKELNNCSRDSQILSQVFSDNELLDIFD